MRLCSNLCLIFLHERDRECINQDFFSFFFLIFAETAIMVRHVISCYHIEAEIRYRMSTRKKKFLHNLGDGAHYVLHLAH
jgi:hypothetical protein